MSDASLVNSLKEIAKELRLIRQELHRMNASKEQLAKEAVSNTFAQMLVGDEHG